MTSLQCVGQTRGEFPYEANNFHCHNSKTRTDFLALVQRDDETNCLSGALTVCAVVRLTNPPHLAYLYC